MQQRSLRPDRALSQHAKSRFRFFYPINDALTIFKAVTL